MPRAPVDPEALLSHASFLRGLAHHLVHGADRADDVVQETWLAALEHPPEPRGGVGPWLARVARNAAAMRRRGDARRDRREHAVARPDRTPSPAEILERETLRRRVVDAVLALDEPYRETVLLRYFEDLPPRAIARRLGLPVETVRTRNKRALERLRAVLDERHGGSRRAWASALVALLPRAPAPAPVAFGAEVAAWSVACLAAAAVALVLWRPWVPATDEEALGVAAAQDPRPPGMPGLAAREDDGAPGRAANPAASPLGSRAGRGVGTLHGFVVLSDRRTPVAGATVVARPTEGVLPDGMRTEPVPADERSTTADGDGVFVFEGLPRGPYALSASKDGVGAGTGSGLAGGADGPWADVALVAEAGGEASFTLCVVDAERVPVAGARVAWTPADGATTVATSGEDGTVRLPRPRGDEAPSGGEVEVESSRGLARGRLAFEARDAAGSARREIRVEPAGALVGRVRGPAGFDLSALSVRAYPGYGARRGAASFEARVAPDGSYAFPALPPGPYAVVVPSTAGLRMDVPRKPLWDTTPDPADYAMPTAVVPVGGRATCDVGLVPGGTLRGRVVRGDGGAPVAGARVDVLLPAGARDHAERHRDGGVHLWRFDGPMPDAAQDAVRFSLLTTDADGRYEATGLFPGAEYRVHAVPGPTLSFDLREGVVVEDDRVTELVHRVVSAGALELVTGATWHLGLRRPGSDALVAAFLTPQRTGHGTIASTIPGLAAGAWELVFPSSGAGSPLARFDVRAGETTFLDALQAFEGRLRGRVTRGGVGVPGAFVYPEVTWPWTRCDAEGRFSIPFGAPRGSVLFEVRPPEADAVGVRFDVPSRWSGGPGEDGYDLALPTGDLVVRATRAEGGPARGVELLLGNGRDGANAVRYVWAMRTSGGDGVARWTGVPAGTYSVTARFPGSGARARGEVRIGDGVVEATLREPASESVRVLVRDESGAPAAGTHVTALVLPGVKPGERPADAAWVGAIRIDDPGVLAGTDGVALLRGVARGRVRVFAARYPGGDSSWSLADGAGHADLDLDGDHPAEVEIRLESWPR